jgi:hypothetical protein
MNEFFRRLRYLLNRRRFDKELANDMEFHREMASRTRGIYTITTAATSDVLSYFGEHCNANFLPAVEGFCNLLANGRGLASSRS